MKIFDTLLNYATQPSTYKGIFTILGACGIVVSEGLTQAIITAVVALFGLVDVIIDENQTKKKDNVENHQ